jgi:hypothetical protein
MKNLLDKNIHLVSGDCNVCRQCFIDALSIYYNLVKNRFNVSHFVQFETT